ncbi:cell division protein FtsX [Lichenicoccus sp.]|uniref:cell division protein FtsX n=1 Tax=Lichenicoccus sp. TaxID=2781899 RepID=UPI003D0ECDD3
MSGHPVRSLPPPERPAPTRPAPARPADGLGLRRAIPDRMLPSVVAAMAFLAALAFAGAVGAHALAARWSRGAGAIVTVQVPDPQAQAATGAGSRIDTVLATLGGTPAIATRHRLDEHELDALLQPWLGARSGLLALPLPAVVELRLRPASVLPAALAGTLAIAAPGTLVEDSAVWSNRLLALTYSLQACAGLALLTVAAVAGWVVALATRAGIARRRGAIELVHGLGATDSYVAGRFARRTGWLALVGGAVGALVALPVLAQLSRLAAPFATGGMGQALPGAIIGSQTDLLPSLMLDALPLPLLVALPALPLATGLIGWLTAQATVRAWLRRLP